MPDTHGLRRLADDDVVPVAAAQARGRCGRRRRARAARVVERVAVDVAEAPRRLQHRGGDLHQVHPLHAGAPAARPARRRRPAPTIISALPGVAGASSTPRCPSSVWVTRSPEPVEASTLPLTRRKRCAGFFALVAHQHGGEGVVADEVGTIASRVCCRRTRRRRGANCPGQRSRGTATCAPSSGAQPAKSAAVSTSATAATAAGGRAGARRPAAAQQRHAPRRARSARARW